MELQDKLDALRSGNAPLPLLPGQADAQALRLRKLGWTYGDIERTMALYHGVAKSADTWRIRLRERGAPVRPGWGFGRRAA